MSKILAVRDSLIFLPGSISSVVEDAVAVVEYWIWDVAKDMRKQKKQLDPTPQQRLDSLVNAIVDYTKFVTIDASLRSSQPAYVNLQRGWSAVNPFLSGSSQFAQFMQSFWANVPNTSNGGFFTVAQVTEPNPGQIHVARTANIFPPLSWQSIFSSDRPNWKSQSMSSSFTLDEYQHNSKDLQSRLKISTPPPWEELGVTIFALDL